MAGIRERSGAGSQQIPASAKLIKSMKFNGKKLLIRHKLPVRKLEI
jgi:hypothetical protein